MGIADWLGRGKDPVLQHLMQACALGVGWDGGLEGRIHDVAVKALARQSFAKGIVLELGDCRGDPCFGFFRPTEEKLREAVEFGPDGIDSWERGEAVRIGGFFLDYEGDACWRTLLERHAVAMADYLVRYSPALQFVYVRFPGIEITVRAPEHRGAQAAPDLAAIEHDLATSVRLLVYVRDAVAKEGLEP